MDQTVYNISPALYNEVAEHLTECVGRNGYFSGSPEFSSNGVECRLVLSAVVYRRRESMPEGEREVISDMVPVWWEFHTVTDEGEVMNDFSFGELRKYFDR